MVNISAIKGALLEEAILYLLRASGYRTVELSDVASGRDLTLQFKPHSAYRVIEVLGRGSAHQIDAIADYQLPRPFSHPQRLLVEAKCLRDSADVSVVRNAFGVYRDVNEFYNIPSAHTPAPMPIRYHYQYAVFSASGFSDRAQEYGYVHDIYLLPLKNSMYMRPVLAALDRLGSVGRSEDFRKSSAPIIAAIRQAVRLRIRDPRDWQLDEAVASPSLEIINDFCDACRAIEISLLAVVGRQIPLLLTPSTDSNHQLRTVSAEKSELRANFVQQDGFVLLQLLDHDGITLSLDVPTRMLRMHAQASGTPSDIPILKILNRLDYLHALLWGRPADKSPADVRLLTFRIEPPRRSRPLVQGIRLMRAGPTVRREEE